MALKEKELKFSMTDTSLHHNVFMHQDITVYNTEWFVRKVIRYIN